MNIIQKNTNDLSVIKRKKRIKKSNKSIFEIYRSEKTIRDYMFYLKDFLNFIYEDNEEIKIEEVINLMQDIDKEDVDSYIVHLFEDRALKKTSVNKIISAMKSLYRELEKIGIDNPFKFVKLFKVSRNIDNVLKISLNDIKKIIGLYEISGEKEYRNVLILYTLFYTGMRSQELLNLKFENIMKREDNFFIKLVETKSGKEQYKPLHNKLVIKINEYKEYLENVYSLDSTALKEHYVFCSNFEENKKLSYRSLNDLIKKLGLLIDKDMSPHNIRHAVATELSINGADILEIRDFLGHADSKVTEVYINAKSILEKRVLEKLPDVDLED